MQRPTAVLHAPGRSTAGTEQFFRPGYRAHLVVEWIPAKAFPQSSFHGFDYHDASIERARSLAEAEGVGANTEFSVAGAKEPPAEGYDLVCFFDCLHDMGDPVGAMTRAREALAKDGTVMLVEPFAGDSLAENMNPVGPIFYAASTLVCTPSSLDQEVGLGLGAQAGEERLRAVAEEAGFSRFRRATETPFNLILEARPQRGPTRADPAGAQPETKSSWTVHDDFADLTS